MKTTLACAAILLAMPAMFAPHAHAQAATTQAGAASNPSAPDSKPSANDSKAKTAEGAAAGGGAK